MTSPEISPQSSEFERRHQFRVEVPNSTDLYRAIDYRLQVEQGTFKPTFKIGVCYSGEDIKITEAQTILIDILKRKPVLLAQASQTIDDITKAGILYGGASEVLAKDYHDFRVYFIEPSSHEDISRLVYSSSDKSGLHLEAFSGRSHIGEYYQAQLEATARSRKIPFERITLNEMDKVKGIPQSGKLTLLPPSEIPQP